MLRTVANLQIGRGGSIFGFPCPCQGHPKMMVILLLWLQNHKTRNKKTYPIWFGDKPASCRNQTKSCLTYLQSAGPSSSRSPISLGKHISIHLKPFWGQDPFRCFPQPVRFSEKTKVAWAAFATATACRQPGSTGT